jgi:D-glycero-beta-D-manno-heptose 1-phosphate adenylyltransferase
MDRLHPDQVPAPLISGRFEFLHKANLAWMLKAIQCASSRAILRFLPIGQDGIMPDQKDREIFLSNFNLDIKLTRFNPEKDSLETDLPVPTPREMDTILSQFIESKLNRTLFKTTEKLLEKLQNTESVRVATTNGCFDILHPGHIAVLKEAKSLSDILIVAVNSDASVRRFKGLDRPVHSDLFRGALLNQLPFVDFVVIFHDPTPLETLEIIKPALHVKGGSYLEERIRSERNLLSQWGGKLVTLPMKNNFSTSGILSHFTDTSFPC